MVRLLELFLLLAVLVGQLIVATSHETQVYIIYMGGTRSDGDPKNIDHADLISSLIERNKKDLIHTYSRGFLGFAARLTDEEAKSLASRPDVVSVFRESSFPLQTTRSWDFLEHQSGGTGFESSPINPSFADGADTIIGFLDSGIWPESESFSDVGMGPIPSHWKGVCMDGENFTSASCNKKLIGARYYDTLTTPRDDNGHGTHVASTAAGRLVPGASYYGLATGTARGGSPGSRIAMYRVCMGSPMTSCLTSAILKAFDDAIADGVDVLSVSLVSPPGQQDFATDPIAIGAFHAVEKGIIVVCAAGNSGPSYGTVANAAPWILTVAATTIDRDFEADVVLGMNHKIKGRGINFSNLNKSPIYPLIDGVSAKLGSNQTFEYPARNCNPESLDKEKVKGRILICDNEDPGQVINKFEILKNNSGAIGMILIDNNERQLPTKYGSHPIASITEDDAAQLLSYMKSDSNPVATILPTVMIPDYKPAPVVGFFSARGPTPGIEALLKPDVAAPGVMILAAWPTLSSGETIEGREPPSFDLISGTSMACPHVAGLAAIVKSQNPAWSSSTVRSAIMTTAINKNNIDSPIMTQTGSKAIPYDIGAGVISVSGPIQPGLIYETGISDYIIFLCDIGFESSKIRLIVSDIPSNFSCLVHKSIEPVSNMNYPSIAISGLKKNKVKTVMRTVTNVGEPESIYDAIVEAPKGVDVRVIPSKLHFTKDVQKQQFQVAFKMSGKSKAHLFGSITWSNDKHKVRSPFVAIGKANKQGACVSFIFLFLCQMLLSWLFYLS